MKPLSYLAISLLFSVSSYAQFTPIPDLNFELELINQGYDSGTPNGMVVTSNIDTITSLSVFGNYISSLSGIEDFSALTTLFCNNNMLTSLDVSQNSNLTILVCYNNNLTNITLNSGLLRLTSYNNSISNLDLSNTPNLTSLNCGNNQLTSLDISQCQNLTSLHCNNNSINSLDLSNNSNIETLRCDHNQLLNIDVSNLPYLSSLNVQGNLLTELDVSWNAQLTDLKCGTNSLTELDVSNNSLLETLICSSNSITSLDVSSIINLERLHVQNNQLTCLNAQGYYIEYFMAHINPDLHCIQVNDVNDALFDWGSWVDHTSAFSTNCFNSCINDIPEESELLEMEVSPNPTNGNLAIDLHETIPELQINITNSLGQIVLSNQYQFVNSVNLNLDCSPGMYYLQAVTKEGEKQTFKVWMID